MVSLARKIPVAVVQAKPEYLDLQGTLARTLSLLEEAAHGGAALACFGETWLPGYPAWLDFCPEAALWNHAPVKEIFGELRANSVAVAGPETAALAKAAARLRIAIVIGINERVNHGPGHGTLYNSLLFFSSDGALVNHHRKLVPTYTERMIWGQGDARGLKSVNMAAARVGGLICWEHWMPLSRQAMHNSGEQVHIAAWPTVHEMHQIASRHYAFEGRCFVIAVGQILHARDLPAQLKCIDGLRPDSLVERGGSAIIAPDGRYLAGPVFDNETILTAELDLREIEQEMMTLDVTGHYSRPDVFDFKVRDTGMGVKSRRQPTNKNSGRRKKSRR